MSSDEISISILKSLSDESRLKIIRTLENGPLTAGDIEKAINKSQSSTSQQLKKLLNSGIVTAKKVGAKRYFQVKNPQVFDIIQALDSYISVSKSDFALFTEENQKILFLGLAGSGKTSLILSILGQKSLNTEITPTKGIKSAADMLKSMKIDIDSENIKNISSLFEGGGSLEDRKDYLKNPEENFFSYDKIVYVIDVQNKEGPIPYINSLSFLKDVMYGLTESKQLKEFIVFLHKMDPGISEKTDFNTEYITEKLIKPIKKAMPPEFNYRIFQTSLSTVFRKGLVTQSFSI